MIAVEKKQRNPKKQRKNRPHQIYRPVSLAFPEPAVAHRTVSRPEGNRTVAYGKQRKPDFQKPVYAESAAQTVSALVDGGAKKNPEGQGSY